MAKSSNSTRATSANATAASTVAGGGGRVTASNLLNLSNGDSIRKNINGYDVKVTNDSNSYSRFYNVSIKYPDGSSAENSFNFANGGGGVRLEPTRADAIQSTLNYLERMTRTREEALRSLNR